MVIVLAYTVRFLAVSLSTFETGFERLSPNLDAAARTLGETGLSALWRVHLPLLMPALGAAALIVFPGGLGTFDELFEILTLAQTGKVRKLPILCFGREFWTRAVNFDYLTQYGVISPQDREAMEFVDDAEEAWTRLLAGGILLPDR